MKRLNYLRQIVKMTKGSGVINPIVKTVLDIALKGRKYVLPVHGVIFDNQIDNVPDVLILPADVVVLEYPTPNKHQYTRRVVVVEKLGEDFMSLCVFHYSTDNQQWEFQPMKLIGILNRKAVLDVDKLRTLIDLPESTLIAPKVALLPMGDLEDIMPDWAEWLDGVLVHEIATLFEFLMALTCTNVSTEELPTDVGPHDDWREIIEDDVYYALTVDGTLYNGPIPVTITTPGDRKIH